VICLKWKNVFSGESPQKVWDILLFSAHSDPQLRGQIALVIGNFINEVLKQPDSYNKFLLLNCSITAYPGITCEKTFKNFLF